MTQERLISQGSSRILTELNIWNKIGKKAQSINSILVKDGESNKIDFDSELISEGPLGYIIENKILKEFVFNEVTKNSLINVYFDVEINKIENQDQKIVKLKTNKGIFESSLVVGESMEDIQKQENYLILNTHTMITTNKHWFLIFHTNAVITH